MNNKIERSKDRNNIEWKKENNWYMFAIEMKQFECVVVSIHSICIVRYNIRVIIISKVINMRGRDDNTIYPQNNVKNQE